jgi:hypothetical protein
MSIIRIEKNKDHPYAQILSATIRDKRLSYKARGILCYLLSLPDGWRVRIENVIEMSDEDGRDAVYSGIKELETLKYLVREQTRREDGTVGEVDYVVYESPKGDKTKKIKAPRKATKNDGTNKIVAQMQTLWHERFNGYFPAARYARVIAQVWKEQGDGIVDAFARYLANTKPEWVSITNFLSKVGIWMEKPQAPVEYVSEGREWK